MDRSLVLALIAVIGVAAFGLFLRRLSARAPDSSPGERPDAILDDVAEAMDDAEGIPEEVLVTSDGWRFVPDRSQVLLMRPTEDAEFASMHEGGTRGEKLWAGEFTGGRVGVGAAGFGPWRLELLGPEGEYLPFPFETEDAARATLAMLERRAIVRTTRDEEGRPIQPSREDFEEARRRYDRTEEELAMSGEEPTDVPDIEDPRVRKR